MKRKKNVEEKTKKSKDQKEMKRNNNQRKNKQKIMVGSSPFTKFVQQSRFLNQLQ